MFFKILFFPLELLFGLIFEGWLLLMMKIIPEEKFTLAKRLLLEVLVAVFWGALLLVFLFGVGVVAFTEVTLGDFWMPVFIPLGLSLLQIAAGVAARRK